MDREKSEKNLTKSNSSERVWSVEELHRLIELIKNYPCLYDTHSPDKKNFTEIKKAQTAISLKFKNCSAKDIDSEWNRLKTRFTRERKVKSKASNNGQNKNRVEWEFYDQMSFMNPHIKQRRRLSYRVYHEKSNSLVNDQPDTVVEMDEEDAPTATPNDMVVNFIKSLEGCSKEIKQASASITEAIKSRPETSFSMPLNDVHMDWSRYCENFAYRVASIQSELARDKIRQAMEEAFISYKHGYKED